MRILAGLMLSLALGASEDLARLLSSTRIDGEVLHANTLEFARLAFRDVTATPRFGRDGGQQVLSFQQMSAKAYRGLVHGRYTLRLPTQPEQPVLHQGEFTVDDIDLQVLVRSLGAQGDGLAGRLSGWVEFTIPAGQVDRTTGRGELHIVDASLVQLPLLVNLLAGDPAAAKGKDRLDARFEIRDGRVQVLWARLESPVAQLDAIGSLAFDGTLRFTLQPRLPFRLIDQVPLLGPVLKKGLGQLTHRFGRALVRGNINRPVIQMDPFGR